MHETVEYFELMEVALFTALSDAARAGLATPEGRASFNWAMDALDDIDTSRLDQIYTPLATDPLTRDYVSRLDRQLHDVATQIDVLRVHIALALLNEPVDAGRLDRDLDHLVRHLRVRFKREAALKPVFAGWLDRHDVSSIPLRP